MLTCNNVHILSITPNLLLSQKPGKAHDSGAFPNTLLMETPEHITLCLARIFHNRETHTSSLLVTNMTTESRQNIGQYPSSIWKLFEYSTNNNVMDHVIVRLSIQIV